MCVYLNAHVFQRMYVLSAFFLLLLLLFLVVCFASFVPVCIWYAHLSTKAAQTNTQTQVQQYKREQEGVNKSIWEKFTLPFAINSKRRYIFGGNRAHTHTHSSNIWRSWNACGKMVGAHIFFFSLSFSSCLFRSQAIPLSLSYTTSPSCSFASLKKTHRLSVPKIMYTCEHSNTQRTHKVCDRNISSKCVPCVTLNYTVTVQYTWKFRFRIHKTNSS